MRRRDKLREFLGKSPEKPLPPQPIPYRQAEHNVPNAPEETATASATSAQNTITINTATGNRALQLAIERHLNDLPEADKEAFRHASKQMTNESLLSSVKACDAAHERESQFRPHVEDLARFLGILDRFMAGVSIGMQANPAISSIVVGAVRVVIDLAVSFVTFFARLSEMLCRFGNYLEPMTKYVEVSGKEKLILESVANVYGDLLRFCHRARAVFVDQRGLRRKWASWRVFWRLQWIPFEDEFGTIESDMQHHLDVLNHSAQALHLNATLDASRTEREKRERERGSFIST
jgi:ankyrin repeat domain-containing protein 50